jgi:NodT family efflux transporter outer membrane factor (OMF) lipoprotein
MRRAFAGIAAVLLGACAVGPDFPRPEAPRAENYTAGGVELPPAGPVDVRQTLAPGSAVIAQWWGLFRSPELDQVLTTAVAGSPTLDAARATLAQAQKLVVAARGAFYPQVDVNASAVRQTGTALSSVGVPSVITDVYSVGPTASFNVDVFGGTRRAVEQQAALAEVQRYELAAAYLSLTGNAVVQAINIAAARDQIQATAEIIAIDERNLELVRIAEEAGKSAHVDVLSAESQLATDRALLPPIKQQLSAARHAVSVLAGKSPAEWTPPDFGFDTLLLPGELPVSLPSSLVRERPDILAVEAQLHAASAAIGVATARLYPDITLSASWAEQAATIGGVSRGSSGLWSLAAGLTAPIFHGGTLEAQRQATVDAFAAQLGTYRATVLQAFGQVADSLRALQHDAEALAAQQAALETAQSSLELTQESFAEGQASLLQLLQAQRLFQQARLGYAKAKGQRYLDTAQLFVAMGGAWREWMDQATDSNVR